MKLLWIYAALSVLISVSGCEQARNRQHEGRGIDLNKRVAFPDTSQVAHLKGEQLAHLYCQLCHQFPEPDMLSKEVWEKKVLPQMGLRLGLNTARNPYHDLSMYDAYIVAEANIFPKEKKITEEKWQKLVAYYIKNAPDSMPDSTQNNTAALTSFQVKPLKLQFDVPALTTMVWFDSLVSQLWVASRTGKTYVLNSEELTITDTLITKTPVVDIIRSQNALHLLQIGIMDPADQPLGELVTVNESHHLSPILTGLHRPVSFTKADLNTDGTDDFIVSNFGNYVGNLTWYDGVQPHQPHTLNKSPGCIKTEIGDFNHDGLPDIMALMAQGDERMIIYYNQGEGIFTEKTILRFPPVYGSSYFELYDFNHDGYLDILYTNGDNADYSVELKTYHGVHIFENNGQYEFSEVFSYPTHGATKAKAADFDADGDLDIALIAYFADFEQHSENGFIFLDNVSVDKQYNFKAHTSSETTAGRWLTLETGDYDHDGDTDIALGAFIYGSVTNYNLQQQWLKSAPDVMLLYNRSRDKN